MIIMRSKELNGNVPETTYRTISRGGSLTITLVESFSQTATDESVSHAQCNLLVDSSTQVIQLDVELDQYSISGPQF